tara:strand:- start:15 stop:926 length:912 start_codon:yes stop_codon:yes gene_type:complete
VQIDGANTFDVLDICKESIENTKKIINDKSLIDKINFYTNWSKIYKNYYDLVFLTSQANVRYELLNKLVDSCNIKNIIFEKVLFQNVNNYKDAIDILNSNKIKGWVNCPRRMYLFYKDIKKNLNKNHTINVTMSGGTDINIASNVIHLVDLVNFFTNEMLTEVVSNELNKEIISNQRKGNIEFTGKLICKFSNGSRLEIISDSKKKIDQNIIINTQENKYLINETLAKIKKIDYDGNNTVSKVHIPFQSELSKIMAENLELNNNPGIVDFETSARLHLPIIRKLLEFYNIVSENKTNHILPIT